MVGTVSYHAEAIHTAGRLPGTECGMNKLWPYTTDGKQSKGHLKICEEEKKHSR